VSRVSSPQTADPDQLVKDVEETRLRIGASLPDIDPGDLVLILQSLLRPPGTGRRFFVRQVHPGVYVP
jgi:hypothetical protein